MSYLVAELTLDDRPFTLPTGATLDRGYHYFLDAAASGNVIIDNEHPDPLINDCSDSTVLLGRLQTTYGAGEDLCPSW